MRDGSDRPEPDDLSVAEVAHIMGVTPRTISRLLAKGWMESRLVGQRRWIKRSELDAARARHSNIPKKGEPT